MDTTWEVPSISEEHTLFLESIHDQLFNLEHVQTALEKGLEKIKKGEGALLAIHGKPCSGKTSLINRVFSEDEDIEFLELDGQFSTLVHVKSKLKSVDKFLEKKSPLVFVLYNFDALRPAFANKVLYTLTNYLRKKAFFLVLVTEKQGAVESLEKRIVSRIGQSSVKCAESPLDAKDCWKILRQMISKGIKACDCDEDVKKRFKLPISMPPDFDRLCNSFPVYGQLKLLVAEMAFDVFEELQSASDFICDRISNLPDDLFLRLRGLTDRMYGLIIAASISTKHITKWIPIKTIYQEYKKFLNLRGIKIKTLIIEKESDFYEDAEYLVFQRFWLAKRQNQKITAIAWMDDPLKLMDKKYSKIFLTDLQYWAENDMKDNRNIM